MEWAFIERGATTALGETGSVRGGRFPAPPRGSDHYRSQVSKGKEKADGYMNKSGRAELNIGRCAFYIMKRKSLHRSCGQRAD